MNSKTFFAYALTLPLLTAPLMTRADDATKTAEPPKTTSPTQASTTVVARVNGKDITRAQLDEAVQEAVAALSMRGQQMPPEHLKQIEPQVLDQMIGQQLAIEKSKSVKIENLDAKVKEQIEKIKKQFPDEKAFAEQLKAMNLTEDTLKQKVTEGLQVDALLDQEVRNKVKVSDEEVKEFYNSHQQYFAQPEQVRASHILITVPKDADEKTKAQKMTAITNARDRVVTKGEDFSKVASEVSEDPGSKSQGGDLGFFSHDQMVKPFADAAFGMKTNEISGVVETQFGYHIIKKTDTKAASTLPLDQEKTRIEQFLKQQKVQTAMTAYIESLKKEAKVEVLLK